MRDVLDEMKKCQNYGFDIKAMKCTCSAGETVPKPMIGVCHLGRYDAKLTEQEIVAAQAACPCKSAQFFTREQAEEYGKKRDAEIALSLKRIGIVRAAIISAIGPERMKQGISGVIDCPVCTTGKVRYSRAGSYNGHVHASCSTAGCVSWME
jgi:hypothetical protein